MEEFLNPNKRIQYTHYVLYNDVKYIRKEVLLQDKPLKLVLHTIKWELFDGDGSPKEYYSGDIGWSGDDGNLKKSNPTPEIEKHFKDTIGKNLVYF